MKIGVAADHAGYTLKEFLKERLLREGHEVEDYGPFNTDPVDYPDMARPLCQAVLAHTLERGILVCGTGIGISIMANRLKGIRCALCPNEEYARLARTHNDANVLALGGRFVALEEALSIVHVFLQTPFSGGHHLPRVAKLDV